MDRNKELGKNTIIFGIGTIGSKLIQFLLVPLYSIYLTTADYSVSDIINSTVTLLLPFLSLGLGNGILRFALNNKQNGQTLIRFSFFICVLSALVLTCLIPVFRLLSIFSGREYYIPLLFLFSSLQTVLSNYCKSLDKNIIYAIDGLISALITTLLSWLFLSQLKMGIDGYLLAILIANIVSVILFICFCNVLPVIFKTKCDKTVIKDTLRYSLPLMPNDLAWWIIQLSDRYMLMYMIGAGVTGIYTMAYKIPGIFNVLVSIFISAFSITAFKEFDSINNNLDVDKKYFENIYKKYLSLTFFAVSVVVLITQPIAYLFIKKDFYTSWLYTPFLLIAFAIGNLEAFCGSLLGGAKKPLINLLSTSCGAIINIIFNFILIPHYGVYGAIIATIFGYVVVYSIRVIGIKKHIKMRLYIIRTIISFLILTLMCICYVNSNIYVRLLSILFALIEAVIYFREIKDLIISIVRKLFKEKKEKQI